MRSRHQFYDIALCLSPNLFNYRSYKRLESEIQHLKSGVIFSDVNPFLGAKYLALVIAVVKIVDSKVRRARYRSFLNADVPRREIVIYYQQLIHYLLSKKNP